jgi:hypothetical protein
MTRTISLALLTLCLSQVGATWAQSNDEAAPAPPEVIPSPLKGHKIPTWVSTVAAADRSGRLRPDRFAPEDLGTLEAMALRNQAHRSTSAEPGRAPGEAPPVAGVDCLELFGGPVMDRVVPKPNRSLVDLVTYSTAIYLGRVQKVEQGFAEGIPQSLLRIKIDENLRQAPGARRESHVFVVYPWARFWLGDQPYCTGVVGTHEPRVGDQILFFRYDSSISKDLQVFVPELGELVFQSAQAGLFLPRTLQEDDEVGPIDQLSNVVALVRAALGHSHASQTGDS